MGLTLLYHENPFCVNSSISDVGAYGASYSHSDDAEEM